MKATASKASGQLSPADSHLSRFYRLGLPALLVITIIAYLNSFAGSWQFDDFAVLLGDARVQTFADWWQSLPHIRPVFKLSVVLNHESGLGLLGFHAVNLSLHLINVLLVYALMQRLLRVSRADGDARLLALFVASVFALHPAQTEAITYLSGRSVALEALGILASALFCLMGRERQQWRWYGLSAVAMLFAIGSRETAIITPLLQFWLAWLTPHRMLPGTPHIASNPVVTSADNSAARQLAGPKWQVRGSAPLLLAVLLSLLLLFVVLQVSRYRELLWLALQWPTLSHLLAAQSQAVVQLLLVASGFAAVNADPALHIAPFFSARGMGSMLLLLVIAVITWRWRTQRPWFALGIGWAAIVWLPTHTVLLRFDPVNDRQLYLALPGLVLALAALTPAHVLRARVTLLVLCGFMLLLAALTWQRNTVYADEVRFWQAVISKSPHNARGWNNLGVAYAVAAQPKAAEFALQQALTTRPDYVQAAVNLKLLRRGHLPVRQ